MMIRSIKNIKKDAIIYPVFDVLINGLNFFIILYINNRLDDHQFSVFNALIALAGVLFIFGVSIQTYTAKSFDENMRLSVSIKGLYLPLFIGFNAIFLINGFWLINYIRTSYIGYVSVLLLMNIHALVSYERGKMQGRKKFRQLNISFYTEVLTRIILTLIILRWELSYEAAVISIALGMLVSYIHGLVVNRNIVKKKERRNLKDKNFFWLITSNGCIFLMTNISILTLNNRLPEISAEYSLATKFSQLLIAVTLSIITILIPYALDQLHDELAFRRFVLFGLAGLFAVVLIIYISYLIVFPVVGSWVLGEKAVTVFSIIKWQAIAYIFFPLSQFLITMDVVGNRHRYIGKLLSMGVLYVILLNLIPAQMNLFIALEVVVHVTLFISLSYKWIVRRNKNEKKITFPIMERHTSQ